MVNATEYIKEYISELNRIYKVGNATEHSYRHALKSLLEKITNGLTVTNEPKRIECGAPDYIVTRKEIPVGYIEAKDIGVNLNDKANKTQFDRYKQSLDNLIITDYLTFQLFKDKNLIIEIVIGKISSNKIVPISEKFNVFIEMINEFSAYNKKAIKDSKKLAEFMAAKTQLLAEVIEKNIANSDENSSLKQQLKGFQQVLLPAMTYVQFADIYAQTIAYGMFVARLQDFSNDNFTRQNTATLIPQSNPFLRNLFQYIAGFDLDENIRWLVDAIADMFNCVDVTAIHKEFESKDKDPFLHFYEDFLTKYDKKLKNARGAYYTPMAVVKFIVNAVDDILKNDFGIAEGLADTSKVDQFHRVQILDPATGTGTFLAEVVRKIYQQFENNAGMWNDYVKNHLIPRLNGFEIMMSPYTIAHLKIETILQEFGYDANNNNRLQIYLADSLENPKKNVDPIPFAQWLSNEAAEATKIKNNVPVMVILGNPPYSGISQNNGKWITDLIEHYKYIDGVHFNEKKHWLQDDYVKFIRFGQYFVEKNSNGILAFINNHGFLDNPTFRGMRWHLLKAFDKIYILDLHGNAKKKETALDGSKDENVFDIQQGVSINIFIRNGSKTKDRLAEVYHYDLYGKRDEKYNFLLNNNLQSVQWQSIENKTPYFFFVPKSEENKEEYEKGFAINELFSQNNVGIVTGNDTLNISYTKKEQSNKVKDLLIMEEKAWREKYNRMKDSTSWNYLSAKKEIANVDETKLTNISYRPFDTRWTYYTGKSGGLYSRPIFNIMQHFLISENVGLVIGRQGQVVGAMPWNLVFLTKHIVDFNLYYRGGVMVFPLYLYPEKLYKHEKREPNLNREIVKEIEKRIGTELAPIDILDYIYAVLHSPAYRERYKEFLKIDFPRVPYPKNAKQFQRLAEFGGKLRKLHLLEDVEPQKSLADFPITGKNEIEKSEYVNDKIYINNTQYFEHVPLEAWNFYIGGYQPAQKWLKDRKGSVLSYDDIMHYKRVVKVLSETGEIMREIDG